MTLGAKRVEIAHSQYYGWALRNRAALMPTRDQVFWALDVVEKARERLKGVLTIDAVVPDYYAKYPKPCMNGWGRQSLNVTPSGKVLPCHAAETIPNLDFWNVREHSLSEIWQDSPAFNAFRGTDWMPPLCKSCERKEIDWGGCRCQAMAIAGDAAETDPACHKSPLHGAPAGAGGRGCGEGCRLSCTGASRRRKRRNRDRSQRSMKRIAIGLAALVLAGTRRLGRAELHRAVLRQAVSVERRARLEDHLCLQARHHQARASARASTRSSR